MLLLQQQNGHLDVAFLRRLLRDHFEGSDDELDPLQAQGASEALCAHSRGPGLPQTGMSLVAELGGEQGSIPLAWCAFGPPCQSVYFPVCLLGELPSQLGRDGSGEGVGRRLSRLRTRLGWHRHNWVLARESLQRLQARFDSEAEDFAVDGARWLADRTDNGVPRQATLFMQHCLELFEEAVAELLDQRTLVPGGAGAV
jgi:hypothetical protein